VTARCNCDEAKALRRLMRLFAWRARLLQLVHSCPAAAKALRALSEFESALTLLR
jgi:hypothetical protein